MTISSSSEDHSPPSSPFSSYRRTDIEAAEAAVAAVLSDSPTRLFGGGESSRRRRPPPPPSSTAVPAALSAATNCGTRDNPSTAESIRKRSSRRRPRGGSMDAKPLTLLLILFSLCVVFEIRSDGGRRASPSGSEGTGGFLAVPSPPARSSGKAAAAPENDGRRGIGGVGANAAGDVHGDSVGSFRDEGGNRGKITSEREKLGGLQVTVERASDAGAGRQKEAVPPVLTPSIAHGHAIPPILIFTHHTNLLTASNFPDPEDPALKANVEHTVSLHPETSEIRFLTDVECETSIRNALGANTPLVHHFRKEKQGMYKADMCRGAALYETGGLYFDVDILPRFNLWDVIRKETEFVVPVVHRASKHPGMFFQAFIGVAKGNPIMKRYLEMFLEYYEHKRKVDGPLGVILLRKAFDDVLNSLTEEGSRNLKSKVQLWQEVLYDKRMFPKVPEPLWGVRRACKFVVVIPQTNEVPFYSRVKGSRMCGGRDTVKK